MDPRLSGVWAAQEDNDPRKTEFAVCAPLDEDRCILHSPAAGTDGIYYEARMLKVRDHLLLQLRMIASFSNGLPKSNENIYTLLWVEGDLKGPTITVFSLDGERLKGKGAEEVRRALESPAQDWGSFFGKGVVYRRLKDK